MSWSIFTLKHPDGFLIMTRKPNLRISIRLGCLPPIGEEVRSTFRNFRNDDRGTDIRVSSGMASGDSRGRSAGDWGMAPKGSWPRYRAEDDARRTARRWAPGVGVSGRPPGVV